MYLPWAFDLATWPAVLDAVADVIGPDILVYSSIIFAKWPGDPSLVSWHQDRTDANPNQTMTTSAWIAMTDSTPGNGCMRVVPMSHTRPPLPHRLSYARDNLLGQGQVVQAVVHEAEALDLVLAAGEMSLHHSDLIHGSGPNHGRWPRIGFVVRYTTPAHYRGPTAVVVARGCDGIGPVASVRRPSADRTEELASAHEAELRRLEAERQSALV